MKYFSKIGLIFIAIYIVIITLLIISEPTPLCVPVADKVFCPAVVTPLTPQHMFLIILLLPGLLLTYGTSGNIGNIIPQVPIFAILINIFIVYLVGFAIERIFRNYKNRKIDANLEK